MKSLGTALKGVLTNRFTGWLVALAATVASIAALLVLATAPGASDPLNPGDRARIEAMIPNADVTEGVTTDEKGAVWDIACFEKDYSATSGLMICTRAKTAEQSAGHRFGVPALPA